MHLKTKLALVVLVAASALGLSVAPVSAGYNDKDSCRIIHDGRNGPKGDYVLVRRLNGFNGSTLMYRDGDSIRFFTRMRPFGAQEIPCGAISVHGIDRIVLKMKRSGETGLIIDQSGRGVQTSMDSRYSPPTFKYKGRGGPFAPGASGRGIRVEIQGQSPGKGRSTYLKYAGTRRAEHVYVSRTDRLISIRSRSASGRPLGGVTGFNADHINLVLGSGDDIMESAGLGPDNQFYDFYFEVFGGKGDDRLLGHDGRDIWFDGGPGDDLIRGRGGDDRDTGNGFGLRGGPGHDVIFGGPGNDWIEGEAGRDSAVPGPGEDEVYMDDGERDEIDCEGNPLAYVVFDRDLDKAIGCPGGYPVPEEP